MFELTTPILFITFNRPDTTQKVFEKIRAQKPKRLYLASDAPRPDVPGEEEVVRAQREYLEESINWECEVIKIYAKENMGCAKRVASALDEVFAREETVIILEDDCVPCDSFFEYCQTLLERYKDDERVLSISGSTVIKYTPSQDKDYYFSKIFWCWGWATWRRAWSIFDLDMKDYDTRKDDPIIDETIFEKDANWIMKRHFDALSKMERKFSWAYIFYFYSIIYDGFHIYPKYNLVENIGFGGNYTITEKRPSYYYGETQELEFPLRDRHDVVWEREYDEMQLRITKKQGPIVHLKKFLGMDTDVSVFSKEFWHLNRKK